MAVFGEPRGAVRIACIGLIVAGILGLRWSTPEPTRGGVEARDKAVKASDGLSDA
jgi:hypothetical protein